MAGGDSVLVTGAYGLVGRPVVERLDADGFRVTATAHRARKPALPAEVDVRPVRVDEAGSGQRSGPGRPGDPDSDVDWYPLDWMDTTRSQQVLSFQRYTFSEAYGEISDRMGWKVRALRMVAPAMAAFTRRRWRYYKQPGKYADP